MLKRHARRLLRDEVRASDAFLDGESPWAKRRRDSDYKRPYLAARHVTADRRPVVKKMCALDGLRNDEVEKWAAEKVERGPAMRWGGLGSLRVFTPAGWEHVAW